MENNVFIFTKVPYWKRIIKIMFQNIIMACFDIFILSFCIWVCWVMVEELDNKSAKDYILTFGIGMPMMLGLASFFVIPRFLYSKFWIYRIEVNEDSVTFQYEKYSKDLELTIPQNDLRVDFFFNKRGPFLGGVTVSQKVKGYRAKEKIYQFFALDLNAKSNRRRFADFILEHKIRTNLEQYPVVL